MLKDQEGTPLSYRTGRGRSAEMSKEDKISNEIINHDKPNDSKKVSFTVINTNAYCLCPKINSLVDCLEEMDAKGSEW